MVKLRSRRDIGQLAQMITDLTGRDATSYLDYGCWCGKGGYGVTVDGVDA